MPSSEALATGYLIDLHVHTTPRSSDSALTPDDAARITVALGMAALCLTEHNNIWGAGAARELSERYGIPVLRGMEVGTQAGHVLVFGVEAFCLEMYDVYRLRRIVEEEGGAMALAHPTRQPARPVPWSDARGLYDALEVLNGDYLGAAGSVGAIARSLGIAAIGGSDAHSKAALGRCATRFLRPVAGERDLIEALRAGQVEPVDLGAGALS
jgi:hypothetical protein